MTEQENENPSPVVLLLIDGWGIKEESPANALSLAQTPNFNELVSSYPSTVIDNIENNKLFYRYLSLGLGKEINNEKEILETYKSFPELISENNLSQFYITETEKFALLDVALQGGREKELAKKDSKLIPSFLESDYKDYPELQSEKITEEAIKVLNKDEHNFLTINLTNIDLIANTADIETTVKAIQVVDRLLLKLTNTVLDKNGTLIITSASGKVEEMFDLQTEIVDIKNTNNSLPLIVVNSEYKGKNLNWPEPPEGQLNLLEPTGSITNIGALILKLLNIDYQENQFKKSLI